MSLLGCEWESIERHEKLRGVVSEVGGGAAAREKVRRLSVSRRRPVMTGRKGSAATRRARNYIFWPQLTKDNVQRKLFKFQGR